MNENDFSAAFDAEDAFASRMDYMRRKKRRRRRRRRRRREVEKEEEEEEEKARRQRASEPRRICFVLDGTQKITCCVSREESRKPAKQAGLPIEERREYREWDGLGFME